MPPRIGVHAPWGELKALPRARYSAGLALFGVKPHLAKTFKLSSDPFFIEKVRDIVGLYLNPPDHAMVLCVDVEARRCQAHFRDEADAADGQLEGLRQMRLDPRTTSEPALHRRSWPPWTSPLVRCLRGSASEAAPATKR